MTDLERFIELYKSVGIELEAERTIRDNGTLSFDVLTLVAQVTPKVGGYRDFLTQILFNIDGSFYGQDVWE